MSRRPRSAVAVPPGPAGPALPPYVDDGRLTGWLIAVARNGKVAHLSSYGSRDREAAAPVEADTVWRLASMTKPITSVAAMMLYEEGAFELKDPIAKWLPSFDEMLVYRSGSSGRPGPAPGHRADAGMAPADPHLRPDLRVPLRPPRRCHVPVGRLRVGESQGGGPGRLLRAVGGPAAGVRTGDRVELRRVHRCARTAGRGGLGPEPGLVLPREDLRTARHGRHRLRRRSHRRPAGRALRGQSGGCRLPTGAPPGRGAGSRPEMLSGGGGLLGTASDYLRFSEMLRRGGELDGTRLLSLERSRT